MADEADRASSLEEMHREVSLSYRKPVPVRTGRCLNCDEPSQGAFCNAGCREDYERFERAEKRNGLRMIEEEE
jgi:hypothetical protein